MVNNIKVTINDDNSITFYNDGDGILVEYMEEHKMYPPTLIFGSLLSGTNFDDNEAREWGGRNGYGAKLANIFSLKFIVETVCHINKKKFYQEFTNNMQNKTEPVITSAKIKPYTKITWYPDFESFNMDGLMMTLNLLCVKEFMILLVLLIRILKFILMKKLFKLKHLKNMLICILEKKLKHREYLKKELVGKLLLRVVTMTYFNKCHL